MTDIERFVESIHRWERFSTRKIRHLDELKKRTTDLGELARKFALSFPEDAAAIEFVSSATVAGYRILDEIGEGGMAIVFKVLNCNENPHRNEALKLLRPEIVNEQNILRFDREMKNLRLINALYWDIEYQDKKEKERHSENKDKKERRAATTSEIIQSRTAVANSAWAVPEFYGAGPEDGAAHFFTMELLSGSTLRDHIAKHGPLPLYPALRFIESIAQALAKLHQSNVIHRDVKPSNIFLVPGVADEPPRIVLLDLGVAKSLHAEEDEESPFGPRPAILTDVQELQTVGALAYSSPQQITNPQCANASDDIYSLGCVLYYLVTGKHAFAEATSLGKALQLHQQLSDRPKLPGILPEHALEGEPVQVPQRVADLFQVMIDPDPERRFRTAQDVIDRLGLVLGLDNFLAREIAIRDLKPARIHAISAYLRHLRDEQVSFSKIPLVKSGLYAPLDTKEVFVEISLQKAANEASAVLFSKDRPLSRELIAEQAASSERFLDSHDRLHQAAADKPTVVVAGPKSDSSKRDGDKTKRNLQGDSFSLGQLLAQRQKLIFLGPVGGGKTTLLKRAALAFAEGLSQEIPGWEAQFAPSAEQREIMEIKRPPPGLIPIFLRLRNFAGYLATCADGPAVCKWRRLVGYLDHYYRNEQKLELPPAFFCELLAEGGCAVFLDGLDEVPQSSREDVAEHVHEFIRYFSSESRKNVPHITGPGRRDNLFVLASRPRGYEHVSHILPGDEYTVCDVKSLSLPSIRVLLGNVLRAIEPNTQTRGQDLANLFKAISSSRELTILAGTPMFCTSLVLVYKSKGAQLPKRRIDVFNEIVDLLLGHWKAEDRQLIVSDETDDEFMAGREVGEVVKLVKKWLSLIAHRMQTDFGDKRTEISYQDVKDLLSKFLVEEEGKPLEVAPLIAETFLKYCHERSGCFVEIETGVFAFTHEGIREYLVANSLANQREQMLIEDVLLHSEDASWEQILLLAGAHPGVADKTREFLLDECVRFAQSRLASGNPDGWARRLNMAGKMAFDMGDSLSTSYRLRLQSQLGKAAKITSECLTPEEFFRRLELALTLDAIGTLALTFDHIETSTLYKLVKLNIPADGQRYLGCNPVTNGEYQRFLEATDFYRSEHWENHFCLDCNGETYPFHEESLEWLQKNRLDKRFPKLWSDSKFGIVHRGLPVVGISWFEANAYCSWLFKNWHRLEEAKANKGLRPKSIRLPTEHEWQQAASELHHVQATANWINLANVGNLANRTTPVGMFPDSNTSTQISDLLGNVWEWQANVFDRSYRAIALRGGAFTTRSEDISVDLRGNCEPTARDNDLGFRILVEI